MTKLALTMCLLCWSVAVVAAEPIDRSVDADPDGVLEVSNVAGEISIAGWDQDRVQVTGELSEDAERLDVIRDGDRVIVRVVMPDPSGRQRGFGAWDETDLIISAPRSMSLEVTSVSANIRVERIEGEQQLSAVSGDIRSETLGEDIIVNSVSGDVLINGQDNPIRSEVSAVSGDVFLRGVSGEVQAQSVSGDVRLDGELLVRGVLNSVSGDLLIHAELAEGSRLRTTTTSGDVELLFRGAAEADYEISTLSGDIDNCFGPDSARSQFGPPGASLRFGEGESDARVSVVTMSGDVGLCREQLTD